MDICIWTTRQKIVYLGVFNILARGIANTPYIYKGVILLKYMEKNKIESDFLIESMKVSIHNNGDCHHNSKLIYEALKGLGYNVKLCTGVFLTSPKNIRHSWIEYKNKILETDCQQLGIKVKYRIAGIITDKNIKIRYRKLQ